MASSASFMGLAQNAHGCDVRGQLDGHKISNPWRHNWRTETFGVTLNIGSYAPQTENRFHVSLTRHHLSQKGFSGHPRQTRQCGSEDNAARDARMHVTSSLFDQPCCDTISSPDSEFKVWCHVLGTTNDVLGRFPLHSTSIMATSPPPGYLSDTEFRFPKNKADAIIFTVSFPRKEFCRSFIWFPPSQHDGIRQSITSPFQRSSNPALGPLERLPAELLNNILLGLDLQSLFNFGQTNLKSREAVYSLKQYRLVLSHGLNLVCALLRTGVATSVSLLDCYRALCTKACAICDGFGGFISC